MIDSLSGRLLVASPVLEDGTFDRTVVLLLEHTEDGALGLVLNRPSESPVADPLQPWAPWAAEPAVVFVGGPVEPHAAICLATAVAPPAEDWQPLDGDLGVLDLGADPAVLSSGGLRLRVFAGYAGWSAGQLEGEIDMGGWYVVDVEPGDVLCADPAHLWRRVLRRQGGTLAMVSTFPPDPRLN